MILFIAGASHTGKTALAQKLLETYKFPYLSIDHLKMGLIRSGNTSLTPVSDDRALTDYLWPIVREMVKTAIENEQNLIVEGCYIPFDWQKDFQQEYRDHIKYICLVMSERYIRNHIKLPLWPKRMQKNNAENFFLMEYILTYADILFRYLLDAGIPQEQANLIATNALDQLALWVDENCIRKCGYACIRRSESSGYCTLCSYMIQPLACPNKKEVTLRQLGMQEEDLVCMRREFK